MINLWVGILDDDHVLASERSICEFKDHTNVTHLSFPITRAMKVTGFDVAKDPNGVALLTGEINNWPGYLDVFAHDTLEFRESAIAISTPGINLEALLPGIGKPANSTYPRTPVEDWQPPEPEPQVNPYAHLEAWIEEMKQSGPPSPW